MKSHWRLEDRNNEVFLLVTSLSIIFYHLTGVVMTSFTDTQIVPWVEKEDIFANKPPTWYSRFPKRQQRVCSILEHLRCFFSLHHIFHLLFSYRTLVQSLPTTAPRIHMYLFCISVKMEYKFLELKTGRVFFIQLAPSQNIAKIPTPKEHTKN